MAVPHGEAAPSLLSSTTVFPVILPRRLALCRPGSGRAAAIPNLPTVIVELVKEV
jgi:hypothetical protein